MVRLINMTISHDVAMFYEKQLKMLFGDVTEIFSYSMRKDGYEALADGDIYLISATATPQELSYIPQGKQIVLTSITFTRKNVDRLLALPWGTKAMLVNGNNEMAIEAIADLNRLGVKNVEFTPYYPGAPDIPNIDLAVTIGEPDLVPKRAKEVIYLEHRTLSANTIMEIALRIGRADLLETEPFLQYFASLADKDFTLNDLSSRAFNMESKFVSLLGAMREGIIGVDIDDTVFAFNQAAQELFQVNKKLVLGKKTQELSSILPKECFELKQEAESCLVRVQDAELSVTITPITNKGHYRGYFAMVQRFFEEEQKQHQLRMQLLKKGHTAKYTFEDIIGESPAILKQKDIARKMARTDASLLLTGESGTGKELFAHAIHNYSPRRNMPFVAINCAALPETLLESELFGYEEGAFTGAKRGGKMGLFELAHKGTLLLDEVEEMIPSLQAKLLRVLQEKEVMRIGANKIINVDVRIIAASNMDIMEMVKNGRFRKDLYYRLNTLPIRIPPLRDRGNDILLIAEYIKKQIGADFCFTPEAEAAMLKYGWDGNIRELRNTIEYLKYMDLHTIQYDDLPEIMQQESHADNRMELREPAAAVSSNLLELFLTICGSKKQEYLFIMKEFKKADDAGILLGRRQISLSASELGIHISEQVARTICNNLERCGFLSSPQGKKGKKITDKGRALWSELKNVGW